MPKDLVSSVERTTTRIKTVRVRRSRGDIELVLRPTVPPSDELLKSVIDEWLVPRLVDEFLRERRGESNVSESR